MSKLVYKLSDLIDINIITKMLDSYQAVTGVVFELYSEDGTSINKPSKGSNEVMKLCHNNKRSTPIIVEGHNLGYICMETHVQEDVADNNLLLLADFANIIADMAHNKMQYLKLSQDNTQKKTSLSALKNELKTSNTELKTTNEQLHISKKNFEVQESRLKKLSNLTFEGILLHDDTVAIDCNLSFTKIIGYEHDEIIGKKLLTLVVKEKYRPLIIEKIKLNYAAPYEVEIIKKDGTPIFVELESQFVVYENQNLRVTAVRDITERRKFNYELSKSRQLLSLHIQQTPLAAIEWNLNSEVISWNKAAEHIFGYSKKEAIGQNISFIVLEEEKTEVEKSWNLLLEKKGGEKVVRTNITKDGSHIVCEWYNNMIIDVKGNTIAIASMAHDITQEMTAKKSLLLSESRLKEAQKIAKLGHWYLDNASQEIEYSDEALRILDIDANPKIMNSKMYNKFIHPEDADIVQRSKEEAFEKKEAYILIYKIITSRGTEKYIQEKGKPEFDDAQQIISLTGTIQDITDRVLIHNELLAAKEKAEESNHLKTSFLNNLSHEIRTPLNGIIGFTSLLGTPNIPEDEVKGFYNIIKQSSDQLLFIVEDIITISTIAAGQEVVKKDVFVVADLLYDIYSAVKPRLEKNNLFGVLKIDKKYKNLQIETDKVKFKRIVNSLLDNALKFTHKGGIEFGFNIFGDDIELYVKDTGIGIRKKFFEQIFQSFWQVEMSSTRKYGGNGLGLSIAKAFAELMGGAVYLESEFGTGTAFYVKLPLKQVDSEMTLQLPKKAQSASIIRKKGKKNILVAEDEESNYLYLMQLVMLLGATPVRAKDGIEAVELCKNKDFDLVFMDLKMPNMDGYQATKEIRSFLPDIPIIAQTAYANYKDREKASEAGCNAYVVKPLDKNKLMTLINDFLGDSM